MLLNPLSAYTKHAPSVREIIAPMHAVGVAGMFYVRIYNDGTIINLANNADWTDFYFKRLTQGQYLQQDIIDQFFTYSGVSLWALNEASPIWKDAKHYFGYSNGVSICEDYANFREVIGFYSSDDDQKMNHFYVNQIDTLKRMKQYFMLQSQEVIRLAEDERHAMHYAIFPKIEPHFDAQSLDCFNKPQSIVLIHKDSGMPVNITPQRGKCLVHLLRGQSMQEIAANLQLSPKTVEHYLEMLRKELGCCSSKELILHYAHQICH